MYRVGLTPKACKVQCATLSEDKPVLARPAFRRSGIYVLNSELHRLKAT
jgi:hypothetical protein